MSGRTEAEAEAWRARVEEALGPLETVAEIHATVELERALRELGHGSATRPRSAEPLLGAVAVVVRRPDRPSLVIVEPTTEGRLAATLARHGEGPAGRYASPSDGLGTARDRAAAAGIALSRPADGPLGRSVLVLGGPVAGPHLVLVEPPDATIRP